MTLSSIFALFGAMIILAVIPGPGVIAVVARTLASGMRHGLATAAGIVAGDFVFIAFALFGLSTLSALLGDLFLVVKYLGAAYLIWLGLSLVFSDNSGIQVRPVSESSHLMSFMAGLVTTLGNPKAILFYLSFFPAFLDLSKLTLVDSIIVYGVAMVAVGGVMCGYVFLSGKAKMSWGRVHSAGWLRYGAGALLMGSGVVVASRD